MRNVLPAFGSTVGSVLAAPGLRNAVLSGVQRALRATSTAAARGVVDVRARVDARPAEEAWKARHTYSLWAFPQADYPKVLAEYFAFCKGYYKEHRYRCNVVSGASRLHQDRGSLFSASYSGPMFTLEPSSTGEPGWDDFLDRLQRFRIAPWAARRPSIRRAPCSPSTSRRRSASAQAVPRAAPADGSAQPLRNSYFAHLLG
jgi:hypothetical protein